MLATKLLQRLLLKPNQPPFLFCCFWTQIVTETSFPHQVHMWCTCRHLTRTTTPRLMEWCATGSCPKLRTALFPICSPSTVRLGTLWRWLLDLIVRSVFLMSSQTEYQTWSKIAFKYSHNTDLFWNFLDLYCLIKIPCSDGAQYRPYCLAWCDFQMFYNCLPHYRHIHQSCLLSFFFFFFFTVNSVRSPSLWSFKSCHTIQMCLFSHGCASDNSTHLSLVTDLLTTHHTAPECSCCSVSARLCVCVVDVAKRSQQQNALDTCQTIWEVHIITSMLDKAQTVKGKGKQQRSRDVGDRKIWWWHERERKSELNIPERLFFSVHRNSNQAPINVDWNSC